MNSQQSFTATSDGTYFVSAAGFGSNTGTYTMSVVLTDDFLSDTSTTGIVSVGGSVTGEIETVGDEDWFAVTLTGGVTYQFDLEGSPTGAGSLSDPLLGLYDASGNFITFDDDGGVDTNSQLSYTASTGGTYFVAAAGFGGLFTGTYTVSVTQTQAPLDDFASDPSTTGIVSVGGSVTGDIETLGDLDWFAVTLTGGVMYQFDLEGSPTGAGTLSDTYLSLYDGGGNFLVSDDDGGVWFNSQLSGTVATSGTYFLEAGGGLVRTRARTPCL